MKSNRKIFQIILWTLSLGVGVPFGYYLIPDKMSVWQSLWYPFIMPFFVCFALMIVKGIFEEYLN